VPTPGSTVEPKGDDEMSRFIQVYVIVPVVVVALMLIVYL
jgi:hypothetical protein